MSLLTWIPPATLTEQCLRLLARSALAAPEGAGESAQELLQRLMEGKAQAYGFPTGMLVLENHKPRLRIAAWAGDRSIWLRVPLARELREIAAEWACDMIETTVFDLRLADAICRIGGKRESVTVTLSVKG